MHDSATSEITLFDLWRVVWGGKFVIIGITSFFTVVAIAYALLATEWYRAGALLAPVEDQSMSDIRGQLSGLAAIAGVRTGAGSSNRTEALAVLRSREFARNFIAEFELMPVFLEEPENPKEQLDMRDAVRFFREDVLRVSEDRDTGQVTLGIQWTDPAIAAEWANVLVMRLNEKMRDRAARDAEANIDFLRAEMASNNVVALEQSISRIMESEMQKLMLARGNEEYSFRIIDRAEPPRIRSRPRRTLIVASAFVVSGILSLLVVFVRSAIRRNAFANTSASI
jgi:LPS O-antigen subunit length determinant protein (WzzB/FepE family)